MRDLIDRQAALDALYHVDEYNGRSVDAIRNLPSAQPKRKKGKWIPVKDSWGEYITTIDAYKCSSCGVNDAYESNYCPYCGADMRGGADA